MNQEKEGLKKKGRQSISLESLSEADLIIPQTDEFGGYSSRLRLNENYVSKKKEVQVFEDVENGGLELNLCDLLGIDIEAKALEII